MKSLKINLFVAIAAVFTLAGCKDPEAAIGTLNLSSKAMWGSEEMQIGEVYEDSFGRPILVEQFRMYISNITAIQDDGSEWVIEDIEQFNFAESWSMAATLPAGNYTGLKIGLGVPEEINADQDPAQYATDHPLSVQSAEGMFWTWNSGYIFTKFEGKTALDGDEQNMTDSYAFHVGSDNFYRTVEINKAFTIGEDDASAEMQFHCDQFLDGENDTIDLSQDFITHTMDNMPLANRFTALFTEAITLN